MNNKYVDIRTDRDCSISDVSLPETFDIQGLHHSHTIKPFNISRNRNTVTFQVVIKDDIFVNQTIKVIHNLRDVIGVREGDYAIFPSYTRVMQYHPVKTSEETEANLSVNRVIQEANGQRVLECTARLTKFDVNRKHDNKVIKTIREMEDQYKDRLYDGEVQKKCINDYWDRHWDRQKQMSSQKGLFSKLLSLFQSYNKENK